MGGSHSPKQTQNQTTMPVIPQWLQDMAQNFLGASQGEAFFGPNNYMNFNPAMVPGVAPFTPTQLDSMQQMMGLGPVYQQGLESIIGGLGGVAGQYGNLLGGQQELLGTIGPLAGMFAQAGQMPPVGIDINMGQTPDMMNRYLPAYYQAATDAMTKQYRNATAPSQMSQAMLSGAFGGSADAEQRALNQFDLGNNLSDLAARMYEPAMEHQVDLQEQGRQFNVQNLLSQAIANFNMAQGEKGMGLQGLSQIPGLLGQAGNLYGQMGNMLGQQGNLLESIPGILQQMYYPSQVESQIGGQQQQQLQNILNQSAQGAQMQAQYPWTVLQNFGNSIASLIGPFTGSKSTGTAKSTGGGGKVL